jgi:CheY-like chemotaxis protein
MEEQPLRVLIASALGRIIAPVLQHEISGSAVAAAAHEPDLRQLVAYQVRYDVIVIDLTWNDYRVEKDFDGLDVLALLRECDRTAPVIFAAQGHGLERDHLQEALRQPEVVCVVRKADGTAQLVKAVQAAAYRYPPPAGTTMEKQRPEPSSIDHYFSRPRSGITAARIAGAIAAGRATDAESLAAVTGLGEDTVNKLVQQLGPLIVARGEHEPSLRMNCQVVYRWCGEHACYIRSWCRRHGQADVLGN